MVFKLQQSCICRTREGSCNQKKECGEYTQIQYTNIREKKFILQGQRRLLATFKICKMHVVFRRGLFCRSHRWKHSCRVNLSRGWVWATHQTLFYQPANQTRQEWRGWMKRKMILNIRLLSLTAMIDLNISTVMISGGAVGSFACFKMLSTRFTNESSIHPNLYDISTAITWKFSTKDHLT